MAKVKARVLVDGTYGGVTAKANDVIEIESADAKASAGAVDANDAAVAYASTLEQNQPKAE